MRGPTRTPNGGVATRARQAGQPLGAYRLIRALGVGPHGEVWHARHIKRSHDVALRLTTTATPQELATWFVDQARTIAELVGTSIVRVDELGWIGEQPFIVMELVTGQTLAELCRPGEPPNLPRALQLVHQIATTMATVHRAGLCHGDLRAENVFVVRDPRAATGERTKIMGFGLRRLLGDRQPANPIADVEALGSMLAELVYGPTKTRPAEAVPTSIDHILHRCTAASRARFTTMDELALELSSALARADQRGTAARAPAPASSRLPMWTLVVCVTLGVAAGVVIASQL